MLVHTKSSGTGEFIYIRPEDEFFHDAADLSFMFPVDRDCTSREEFQPMRLVLVIAANQVPEARAALDAAVGNAAAKQCS